MSNVIIPLALHKAQGDIYNHLARFRVAVNGRRFGKTALGITELFIKGLSYKGRIDPRFPVSVVGILPTANQARKVIWQPLVNILTQPSFLPLIKGGEKGINNTLMTITLINEVVIRVVGANDHGGDRLRGLKIFFAWLDETQDIKRVVWDEVIEPAMTDTEGSHALFTGTPKGKQNFLYELAQKEKDDSDWKFFNFPTWANPTIKREEIERKRLILPPRLFSQEYEANFVDFPGKFYTELDTSNKYYEQIPDFNLVVAGIDWGDIHPAIAVLGRDSQNIWYFVDGYSPNPGNQSQPVTDGVLHSNIKRLANKWGITHFYCDPSRPSAIMDLRNRGFKNSVSGFNRISEGISQVHSLINKKELLFAPGLADNLLDAVDGEIAYQLMSSYHRETNKAGDFTDTPADGYFSHICDATRYALAVKNGQG